jgi:hypothetical protein
LVQPARNTMRAASAHARGLLLVISLRRPAAMPRPARRNELLGYRGPDRVIRVTSASIKENTTLKLSHVV